MDNNISIWKEKYFIFIFEMYEGRSTVTSDMLNAQIHRIVCRFPWPIQLKCRSSSVNKHTTFQQWSKLGAPRAFTSSFRSLNLQNSECREVRSFPYTKARSFIGPNPKSNISLVTKKNIKSPNFHWNFENKSPIFIGIFINQNPAVIGTLKPKYFSGTSNTNWKWYSKNHLCLTFSWKGN